MMKTETLQEIIESEASRCEFVTDLNLTVREYAFLDGVLIRDTPAESPHAARYLDRQDQTGKKKLVKEQDSSPLEQERRMLAFAWAQSELRDFYEAPIAADRGAVKAEVQEYLRIANQQILHDRTEELMSALYAMAVHRTITELDDALSKGEDIRMVAKIYCDKKMPEVTDYVINKFC